MLLIFREREGEVLLEFNKFVGAFVKKKNNTSGMTVMD